MAEEKKPEEKKAEEKKPEPKDNLVETKHSVVIGGKEIKYTVTAGTIVMKEETPDREKESEGEKPKAAFFFVAYTKDGVDDKSKRPLTFSFNGGPGSSSVWLHLGLLVPRRVVMGDAGELLPPPYSLTDNEFSLLDQTDLVFIDPVSTGYSRPVEGQKAKEFHGFKKDIETVGDFIRLYTTRYGRWFSPKFLAGESYGTTRSAGLSGYLQERHGLYLNGIMLISAVLDFSTLEFEFGNDLPYVLFLPTYAATAQYHGKVRTRKPIKKFLAEVEKFADGEYAAALAKGAALSKRQQALIAERLARYTGLSRDYIEQSNLRPVIFRFCKQLLRDKRRTVGRLDSRFLGMDRDAAGEVWESDPSMDAILGPYTAALYDYVRNDLKFESDLPYEILNGKVWPWSYADHENRYLNVAETLRHAMCVNPHLKVHVANGFYDLATPYFATRYTFNRLGLEPELRGNLSMSYYEAGHMMYVHVPSLKQLKAELAKFINNATT
ncbi:MAG: peptidase S10 [Chloroflexi bacterium]|nr:peptidase S10 [Chloroflexota bacterium]